ncbi:MAG: heavy metal translocating P-type ATPase, partial [Asticcacaulis sp.]
RVNFSTQRLRVTWPRAANDDSDPRARANGFAEEVEALGYRVAPFDPDSRTREAKAGERNLLACLAVAGFATGNVMLFSQALWFSPEHSLEGATRDLMHWVMGLIALPAAIYAGRPFFRSALGALSHGRTNMDVPISLAVILANALSLFETIRHGRYVYFDASVMLLFFLLIGRYLDLKARGRAREAADGLLAMLEGTARILRDGQAVSVRIRDLAPEDVLLVSAGEKIAADGVVRDGRSEVDTRMVTGETLPRPVMPGDKVYAGMINQSSPLSVTVTAAADNSLLSDIIGLMEKAEQSQSPYVRFADRVARLYAPVVHALALTTFIGWMVWGHYGPALVEWEDALLKAMAVLIITCPCALGLAVPVVHVVASSELFRRGILLKSAKGLEAMARIDTVVFDKTGTLTLGTPQWLNPDALDLRSRRLAAAMAMHSQHPLSQAIAALGADAVPGLVVEDHPGQGLSARFNGEALHLGKAAWLGVPPSQDDRMELWFRRGDGPVVRLIFADVERVDAALTVASLRARGLRVLMLSGDRAPVAEALAARLGIDEVRADLSPVDKVAIIEALQGEGRRVLMVGDGLNDAAALTAASVSLSPSSAVDITQNAADFVFRGEGLAPVLTAFDTARVTRTLVRQNFALSLAYNAIAVPAAILGLVTPLFAALAMSGSSLAVVLNSLRLKRKLTG